MLYSEFKASMGYNLRPTLLRREGGREGKRKKEGGGKREREILKIEMARHGVTCL